MKLTLISLIISILILLPLTSALEINTTANFTSNITAGTNYLAQHKIIENENKQLDIFINFVMIDIQSPSEINITDFNTLKFQINNNTLNCDYTNGIPFNANCTPYAINPSSINNLTINLTLKHNFLPSIYDFILNIIAIEEEPQQPPYTGEGTTVHHWVYDTGHVNYTPNDTEEIINETIEKIIEEENITIENDTLVIITPDIEEPQDNTLMIIIIIIASCILIIAIIYISWAEKYRQKVF